MIPTLRSIKSIKDLEKTAENNPSLAFDIALVSAQDARQRGLDELADAFISLATRFKSQLTLTPRQELRLRGFRALEKAWNGDAIEAHAIINEFEAGTDADADPELTSEILRIQGILFHLSRDYESANKSYLESIHWATISHIDLQLAKSRLALALFYVETQQLDQTELLLELIAGDLHLLSPNDRLSATAAEAEVAAFKLDFQASENLLSSLLKSARHQTNMVALARGYHALGRLHLSQSNLRTAASSLQAGLRYARKYGLTREEANILLTLSATQAARGQLSEAFESASTARKLSTILDDKIIGAYADASLGRLQAKSGLYADAVKSLQTSVGEFLRVKIWRAVDDVLVELILIARQSHDAELLTRVVRTLDEQIPARDVFEFREVYQIAGETALSLFSNSALATQLFDKALIGSAEKDLDSVYLGRLMYISFQMIANNDIESGVAYLNRLLESQNKLIDDQLEFQALSLRGEALLNRNEFGAAGRDFFAARDIAVKSEDRAMLAIALKAIARLYMRSNRAHESLEPLERALNLADELSNDMLAADLWMDYAMGFAMLQRWDDALPSFNRAQLLAAKIKWTDLESNAWSGMAHVYSTMMFYERAVEASRNALITSQNPSSARDVTIDLIGLADSLSRLNLLGQLRQELSDLETQARDQPTKARWTISLFNAAIWSLEHLKISEAAEFTACAIVLSSRKEIHEFSDTYIKRVGELARGISLFLGDHEVTDPRAFWRTVSRAVKSQSRHAYSKVQRLIEAEAFHKSI
jgi:hypothetical protein